MMISEQLHPRLYALIAEIYAPHSIPEEDLEGDDWDLAEIERRVAESSPEELRALIEQKDVLSSRLLPVAELIFK